MDTGFGGEWCRRSDGLNLRQKLRRMCDARLQSLTQILLFLHRHFQLRIKTPDIALQGCNARKEDILQRILRLVVDGGQGLGRRRCRQKAQQERHRKHDDRSKLHIVGRRRCWRCRVSSNIIPEDRGCSRRWREDITNGSSSRNSYLGLAVSLLSKKECAYWPEFDSSSASELPAECELFSKKAFLLA